MRVTVSTESVSMIKILLRLTVLEDGRRLSLLESISIPDSAGQTCLHVSQVSGAFLDDGPGQLASISSLVEIVTMLLESGADVNAKDHMLRGYFCLGPVCTDTRGTSTDPRRELGWGCGLHQGVAQVQGRRHRMQQSTIFPFCSFVQEFSFQVGRTPLHVAVCFGHMEVRFLHPEFHSVRCAARFLDMKLVVRVPCCSFWVCDRRPRSFWMLGHQSMPLTTT